MKYFFTICLLLSAVVLNAQSTKTSGKADPAIRVSKSTSTTIVNNQPASMPGSNNNPTTGTVISLKQNKNTAKPTPMSKTDTNSSLQARDSSWKNSGIQNKKGKPKKKTGN